MTQAQAPISFGQTHAFPASPDAVAAALLSPEMLKSAIPRCKEVREVGPGKFWIVADLGILNMTFEINGTFTTTVKDPSAAKPKGMLIVGSLRTRNFAVGVMEADMTFAEKQGVTTLTSKVQLRAARKHGVWLRKTATVIGKALVGTFMTKLATAIAA